MENLPIELASERGRIQLRLCCLRMGADLCVTLSGGDRPHIGAVALSEAALGEARHPTTSVITLRNHREDALARRIACQVAAHSGVAVCVACGIHVEAIQPKELADVLAMAEELTRSLLERLSNREQ